MLGSVDLGIETGFRVRGLVQVDSWPDLELRTPLQLLGCPIRDLPWGPKSLITGASYPQHVFLSNVHRWLPIFIVFCFLIVLFSYA